MQFKSEESKKYWCPFKPENCEGAGCAAWKWVTEEVPYTGPVPKGMLAFDPRPRIETGVGYCGLVGQ